MTAAETLADNPRRAPRQLTVTAAEEVARARAPSHFLHIYQSLSYCGFAYARRRSAWLAKDCRAVTALINRERARRGTYLSLCWHGTPAPYSPNPFDQISTLEVIIKTCGHENAVLECWGTWAIQPKNKLPPSTC